MRRLQRFGGVLELSHTRPWIAGSRLNWLFCVLLGKDLRLRLIAEGVETAEQARYLSDRGVEFAQGWHFAKAMAVDELADSLNRQAA